MTLELQVQACRMQRLPPRCRWITAHILPHEPELRGWLRQRLGPVTSDIDDVVQEVFARIWVADLSRVRNGRAYLFATTRNLLGEHARRNRLVRMELLSEIESLNLISEDPGPELRVSTWQQIIALQAVVAALPGQCRRVFELLKYEGLSHREVALRLGLRQKTVENHLTRALARIGASLATEGTG